MNRLSYVSILFFSLTILVGCKKNIAEVDNSFYNKTFKWSIIVPEDYQRIDQKEVDQIKNEAEELLDKKNNSSDETSNSILAFNKNDSNYFIANYEIFSEGSQFIDMKMKIKDYLIIKNIEQIFPTAKTEDYTVNKENVSGLEFRKARIVLTEKGKTIATAVIFSRLFNDKIFMASIIYEDENYGKEMIDLFKKSTFKK